MTPQEMEEAIVFGPDLSSRRDTAVLCVYLKDGSVRQYVLDEDSIIDYGDGYVDFRWKSRRIIPAPGEGPE